MAMDAGEDGRRYIRDRCTNLGLTFPAWREADAWVMRVWGEMVSRLGVGSQLEVLRFRCKLAGLRTEAEQAEVWERVSILEGMSGRG